MISISSGLIKGLNLRSPQGDQTRPSSERLRQGTFNIMRHFRWGDEGRSIIDDGVIADLFAGSGAWGLEAVSNGAACVQFVESHRLAVNCLQQNMTIALRALKSQGLTPSLDLLPKPLEDCYGKLKPSRVIFADPPYRLGWFSKVIELEGKYQKLLPGGVLLFEALGREKVLDGPGVSLAQDAGLTLFNEKVYGDSTVYFFVKGGGTPTEHPPQRGS